MPQPRSWRFGFAIARGLRRLMGKSVPPPAPPPEQVPLPVIAEQVAQVIVASLNAHAGRDRAPEDLPPTSPGPAGK